MWLTNANGGMGRNLFNQIYSFRDSQNHKYVDSNFGARRILSLCLKTELNSVLGAARWNVSICKSEGKPGFGRVLVHGVGAEVGYGKGVNSRGRHHS